MLEITNKIDGSTITFIFNGRLDTTTAPDAERTVFPELEKAKNIIIDFQDVEYISSSGLRMLLSCQKRVTKNGQEMRIIHVNEGVNDVFEVTGFSDILTIETI